MGVANGFPHFYIGVYMSALTDERICSNACLLIGADGINSFSDGTVESQAAEAFFETTLAALLCERRWSFSIKQEQFSQLSSVPVTNWPKAYQIPTDMLKLWKVYPEYINYELFGNSYLYSDFDGEVMGEYTYRVETQYLPSYFVELLEVRLAMKFCMPITEDENKLRTLTELDKTVSMRAKTADSQQRKNVGIKRFPLITVRG